MLTILGKDVQIGDELVGGLSLGSKGSRLVTGFEEHRTASGARVALCGAWQIAIPDEAAVGIWRASREQDLEDVLTAVLPYVQTEAENWDDLAHFVKEVSPTDAIEYQGKADVLADALERAHRLLATRPAIAEVL